MGAISLPLCHIVDERMGSVGRIPAETCRRVPATGGRPSDSPSINRLLRNGNLDRAEIEVTKVMTLGLGLPLTTWNSLIHASTKAGRFQQAEQYMAYLEAQGLPVNVVTYNSVINACAVARDGFRAAYWWKRMTERGIQPTIVTFGTVCKALAYCGDATKIQDIMDALELSGNMLGEHFYAALIIAFSKSQPPNYAEAANVLKSMECRNLSLEKVRRVFVDCFGDALASEAFHQYTA